MSDITLTRTDPTTLSLEKHSDVLYSVTTSEGVVGYIERAGDVWVTLQGNRLDLSVEIGQSLELARAITLLVPEA